MTAPPGRPRPPLRTPVSRSTGSGRTAPGRATLRGPAAPVPPPEPPRRRARVAGHPPAGEDRRPVLVLDAPGARLRGGLAVLVVLLLVLGGRLVHLQVVSGTAYAEVAEKQRRVTRTLPAPRGAITDRDGLPLALTVESRAVTGQPRTIAEAECPPAADKPCTPATIAAALSPVIGVPVDELTEKLSREVGFVYLARELDIPTGNRVRDLRLLGIGVESEPRRVHPGKDLAANVVGFTNREGKGAAGVELGWEQVLAGQDGSSVAEVDTAGRVIPSGEQRRVEPVRGRAVRLTLDRDLQWYAQRLVAEKVEQTEADSGTAVVLDVQTGEVLALAVAPTFDADDPGDSEPEDRGNPAVGEMYDPGSVNKVIVAAAALEQGLVTPETVLTVPYSQKFGAKLVTDSHRHPTERYTFNGVLMQSSNVGTVQVAEELGPQRIYDALRDFGFGEKTGIGLPGEVAGLVPRPENWSGSSMGTIPIGQGVSVTALQVASVYQTVANGGVRVAPRIVSAVQGEQGELVPPPAPPSRRVISAATAAALQPMLEGVVSTEGTAPLAAIPGYRIAGKTGTADRAVDGKYDGSYTSSFVGYAPADAPRLVTAVVVQGTGKRDYYGGTVAGPVFKQVMGFALRRGAIPPTGVPFRVPEVFADGR